MIKMNDSYDDTHKRVLSHGYLDGYITMWFDKAIKQKECALFIMDAIKNSKYGMMTSAEILHKQEWSGVTYYTALKKLKQLGILRREAHYYKLDSQFSLKLIRICADFIKYADIKSEKQKEEVVKMVMGL